MLAPLPHRARSRRTTYTRGVGVAACALALAGCRAPAAQRLPDLVGMSLAHAETAARTAGFPTLTPRDLLQSRIQMAASNWQVCTQSPAAGAADRNAAVVVGVVRTEELCPGANTGLNT